ncbi:ArsR/SmtB family transcription factor [Microbacterium sp. MAHUQ-60]|uniref:ArsR/SmtB family transcription factor n=1 Tax=unclassified Microbacterium TaxID=2609290 RepID=UPI00361FB382
MSAHIARGDFDQLSGEADDLVSTEPMRELLQRYFGADFSVGTSLMVLSVVRGWSSVEDLVSGIREMSPPDLARELLVSTTLEPKDLVATRELVESALASPEPPTTAVRSIVRRNSFVRENVELILTDPAKAHAEFLALLDECARNLEGEQRAGEVLSKRVDSTLALIRDVGRERGLLEITGGWTLRDQAQHVTLVPTEALGPLVITRLLAHDRIMVAFGPPRDRTAGLTVADLAAVARALGSEQRIAILQHITREPASGKTLAKALGLTQATVHYHTSLLRSAGVVKSVRDAHSVLHAVDSDHLSSALAALGAVALGEDSPEESGSSASGG